MVTTVPPSQGIKFLDMQAAIGITKHPGGFAATDQLLTMCHVAEAHDVLNVGCGIGVGSVYVAKRYGCWVTGVDLSEKMIEWSRQRAREENISNKVEFCTGDVLNLPFAANRFDLVYCESVLNFVANKQQAITELGRVTKPGGYVGINEMFWLADAPVALAPQVQTMLGTDQPLPTAAIWQALWEATGLREQEVRVHPVDPRQEVKDRIRWIGWRWMVRAWGRALRLFIVNPGIRRAIKEQFDLPLDVLQQLGYGLFVGKK